MSNTSFLFDTYVIAERTLAPVVLNEALGAAIRLGQHALDYEREAAFHAIIQQQLGEPVVPGTLAEDLTDLLRACVRGTNELKDTFVRRLVGSSNFSAIRVTLAQLFEQEYGGGTDNPEQARERRRAIRWLCEKTPLEVWSDILQGELKPEDADFLSASNFTVIPSRTSLD